MPACVLNTKYFLSYITDTQSEIKPISLRLYSGEAWPSVPAQFSGVIRKGFINIENKVDVIRPREERHPNIPSVPEIYHTWKIYASH